MATKPISESNEDPVTYTMVVQHFMDGRITLEVQELNTDLESGYAVAAALRRMADRLDGGEEVGARVYH